MRKYQKKVKKKQTIPLKGKGLQWVITKGKKEGRKCDGEGIKEGWKERGMIEGEDGMVIINRKMIWKVKSWIHVQGIETKILNSD